MYNNIGRKIKSYVEICVIIGIIICLLSGILGILNGLFCNSAITVVFGVLFCILGPFMCWLSGFILYAYGQLVENSDILVEIMEKTEHLNASLKQNADMVR